MPSAGTCADNPIDLGMMSTFNRQNYIDTLQVLGGEPAVDIIIMTSGSWQTEYVEKVIEAGRDIDKPIVLVTTPAMRVVMQEPRPVRGLAVYHDGRRAVKVLGQMVRYQRYRTED